MNCKQACEWMSAYFDGELNVSSMALATGSDRTEELADSAAPLAVAIREHIASCDACACELRSFEQIRQLATSQQKSLLCPPSWESMALKLDQVRGMALATDSDCDAVGMVEPAASAVPLIAKPAASTVPLIRRLALGGLLTLAASALLFFSLRTPPQLEGTSANQANFATLNLQPLIELFNTDSDKAMATLVSQHPTTDVTLATAEAEFGRPTFVQNSASSNSLPGNAHLVSTKLVQFPNCKCAKGICTCGPGGCSCVACVCQRPDGSTYLVLEHCKSQSVTFGDLPVQIVKRGDRHLQQVEVQGTTAISWEQDGERLTAIGLRGFQEIDTLLANN